MGKTRCIKSLSQEKGRKGRRLKWQTKGDMRINNAGQLWRSRLNETERARMDPSLSSLLPCASFMVHGSHELQFPTEVETAMIIFEWGRGRKGRGGEWRCTRCGAGSRAIRARVMIPNWPRPPSTAWNSSGFCPSEHVDISPFPVYGIDGWTRNQRDQNQPWRNQKGTTGRRSRIIITAQYCQGSNIVLFKNF